MSATLAFIGIVFLGLILEAWLGGPSYKNPPKGAKDDKEPFDPYESGLYSPKD